MKKIGHITLVVSMFSLSGLCRATMAEEQECSIVVASYTPDLCSMVELLCKVHAHAVQHALATPHLTRLCEQFKEGLTTAPLALVEDGLEEAITVIALMPPSKALAVIDQFAKRIEEMYAQLESQGDDSLMTRSSVKTYRSVNVQRQLRTTSLVVRRNALIADSLIVGGTVTVVGSPSAGASDAPLFITSTGVVTRGGVGTEIGNGCQAGPLTIGTNNPTALTLATNGGCKSRMSIDANGAVSVAAPDAGTALAVASNATAPAAVLTGNSTTTAPALRLINNPAATGTENILAIDGSGNVVQSSTALDGLVQSGCQAGPLQIGTNDGSSVSLAAGTGSCTSRLVINGTGNVTIAAPNSGTALTIADGGETISSGNLTVSSGQIVTSSATLLDPIASSPGIISLGGAPTDKVSIFELSTNNFCIGNYTTVPLLLGENVMSIGNNANGAGTSANNAIAIGANAGTTDSASGGVAIGNNTVVSGSGSIGLGSGATTSADNSMALGYLSSASGVRSSTIGTGATTSQADAIVLGDSTQAALAVGIGINAPAAKLHVVGIDGTPVTTFVAGNANLASAPVLTNLSAAGPDLVLNINGSGQVYVVGSSKRFKENFRQLDDIISKIYQLHPLMFDYKAENGGAKDHAGFIAEEVAEVFPSLVNYDGDGKPYSVKYECFHALAIKELQNHKKQIDILNNALEHYKLQLDEQAAIIKMLLAALKVKVEQQ